MRRISATALLFLIACSGAGSVARDAGVVADGGLDAGMGVDGCADAGSVADGGADAGPPPPNTVWSVPMRYGFEGSPTLCDLDHDGHPEAVVPLENFTETVHTCDLLPLTYVAVLDATSGTTRWQTPDGMGGFAYPLCVPVDSDGIDDVIVAGRSGDVTALSGADGHVLWSMAQKNPGVLRIPPKHTGGTYSSVVQSSAPDVLFVTNGGGGSDSVPDVPGQLIAYGHDGSILATWQEPNSSEIYASPAVILEASTGDLLVAVGAGNEREQGSLHLVAYDPTTKTFTLRWSVMSACATGGFEASPVFGDIDGDHVPDVVDDDFCGTVHAMTLAGAPLWTATSSVVGGTANPLLLDLDGDGTLDVASAFQSVTEDGTEANPHSEVVGIHGPDGTVRWRHAIDGSAYASPVSADRDGDGIEDIWLLSVADQSPPIFRVVSGASGQTIIDESTGNSVGTPVLGDFDGNGIIDLLLTDLTTQVDGNILRLEFAGVPWTPAKSFSGFRGVNHDGYRP